MTIESHLLTTGYNLVAGDTISLGMKLPITVLIHSRTDDDDIMEAIEVGDGEGEGEGSDGGEGGEEGEGDTSEAKVENDQVILFFLVQILKLLQFSFL